MARDLKTGGAVKDGRPSAGAQSLGEQRTAILSVAGMRAAEAAAMAAGTPEFALMKRAGEAAADAIRARWSPRETLVLAGPGNNGGDGYVVARALAEAGWPVTVAAAVDAARLRGAAKTAAESWAGRTVSLASAPVENAALVVDALFGTGLARALKPEIQAVLARAEATGAPLVAIDLPSGLAGDTGRASAYAPRCILTITFQTKKPAHVLEPGRRLCGEIVVADIGLIGAGQGTRLFENDPALWLDRFPWPRPDIHKHARGRLAVVAGNMWSGGAARLSARAGLRIGAGLVTLLSGSDALAVNAGHLEAVMLQPFDSDIELEEAAANADAAVIGPAAGINHDTYLNLMALARTGAALVIDADALTVFRDDPAVLFSALDRDDVLTPHVGEFERVFPGLLASSPERVTAARKAAERAGAVVLLKGPDTVVAAPDGRVCVNTRTTPWLATAGSGDVLSGFIGGLLAQGMETFEAAAAAVWIHSQAALNFGPGLIAEDLPDLAPAVLKDLLARAGG